MCAMDSDIVVKIDDLSKKFCRNLRQSMLYGVTDVFRSMIGISYDQTQLRKDEFWALKNINLELKKGETLGIIGVNGSGKSTLLRLITGIFPPDKGKITVNGRIGSLIAVGAGFHPHMTGRENIFLNGTILGMTKKEIKERFDNIVNFADIGEFLDAPVSTYSSGMRIRLGFAIAINSNVEILLIDELLSVGDIGFQNKALRKMSELRKKAYATIFVSHNLEHIRNLCTRVIVMNSGKIIYDGETSEGVIKYQELSHDMRLESVINENKVNVQGIIDTEKVIYLDSGILNSNGEKVNTININEPFTHYIEFEVLEYQEELFFSSGILDEKNNVIIWVISNDSKLNRYIDFKKGKYRILITYFEHHLMPGIYSLSHGVRNPNTFETFQRITYSGSFKVTGSSLIERGIIRTEYNWILKEL
jgi:lipopolysaccharide transport system ATP-binding protein